MYLIYSLPLLLLFFSTESTEAADDNPITTRFHCRGSCCDHHEWCRFWASVGECKSNREWMSDNCQLACGTCRRGATRTSRPGVAPSVRPPRPGRGRKPLSSPRGAQRSRRPNRKLARPTRPSKVSFRTTPFARATRPRGRPTPRMFLRHKGSSSALGPELVVAVDVPPARPDMLMPPPAREHLILHDIRFSPPRRHESTPQQGNRPDMLPPRQDMMPPRQDMMPPRQDMLPPRQDMMPPRFDMVQPRPDVMQPRQDMMPPRFDVVQPRSDVMPPRQDMMPPRFDVVQPRPDMMQPRPDVLPPRQDMMPPRFDMAQPRPDMMQPRPDTMQPRPDVLPPSPNMLPPRPDVLPPSPDVLPPRLDVLPPSRQQLLLHERPQFSPPEQHMPTDLQDIRTDVMTTSMIQQSRQGMLQEQVGPVAPPGGPVIGAPTFPEGRGATAAEMFMSPGSTTPTGPFEPFAQETMMLDLPRTRTRPTRPTRPKLQQRTSARPRPTPRPAFKRQPITTSRPTSPRTAAPRNNRNAGRCQEILRDPLLAAEQMWREHLVVSTEDNSNRRTVDLDGVIRSNLASACVPRMDETSCERNTCYNAYFRTMDGTCNNLQNPLRGAAYRPYTRLLPTVYDNELSEPVASMFPHLRPSPREITRRLTSSHASVVSDDYNALIMQFGQFISHDMAKTTLIPSAKCNVCQNITSRCMAVPIAKDDPNLGFRKNTCVRVSRSSPICGSGNQKPRQQLNENTGYIDASPIYGSSVHDSEKFRQGKTGFLKLPAFNGMQMLPFDQSKCKSKKSCTVIFTAGDSRVNLFVGLSAWHTIFTKEHNRIVSAMIRMNPHWDGERLYHEARKIVGAEVQAIVYREWLPKILGAAFSSVVGDYRGYDPSIDATVANEFTSAAFRFGHGMIQEFYQRLDPNFGNSSFGALPFQKGTLHSDVLVNEGGPDPLLRGMFSQNVKRPQRVTTTVTENMFGSTDLSSINIQRGRDHGHPSYTKYRELCGMGVATSFDHLSREILNTGTRDKLQKVYGSVDRIDLWVGALLEDPVVRGLVGPTVACIVGPQFKRTRDGDRFYYENPGVFTRAQLSEIRKSSLSRIICDNSNTISMVPREAFRIGHLTPCSQIPQMDLSKWKE
ncbi:hypothetical protein Y032_0002g591 [Ancylostoma ceylanicum]|uniref:peroxidase n=1 Tax=Ancylostoma ceylanicum TaxID=53326 RepID=A0A016VZU8_9BILA|nr:hypothetical protein Y032_0002g591 [Ancylostoma ceylanicum]